MVKPDFTGYTKWNSWYDNAIIWDTYGYWSRRGSKPEWCTAVFIAEAKSFALNLKEPKIELWFSTHSDGENYNGKKCGGKWITYDSVNKIIIWENAVGGCSSERSAESYIKNEHSKHVYLMGEVIKALIVYKNTGIACLPDWNKNETDSYGYKNGECNLIPRAKEITDKELNEKFKRKQEALKLEENYFFSIVNN